MKPRLIIILFLFFNGCSNNKTEEIISNKNDSIILLQTNYLNSQKEIAELKKFNEAIIGENVNLKKELNDLKKSIEESTAGPDNTIILKDLNKYMEADNAAGFMNAIRETYTAEVVGNSESANKDIYISQCQGKASYSANDMMGYSYISFDFQAEVYFKKFGGEWQFKDVNLKKSNVKRQQFKIFYSNLYDPENVARGDD